VIASVSGSAWLNVFVKNAGTSDASSAENSDIQVVFVILYDIKNAGITSSVANMFGIIFSNSGRGMNSAKNASIASNTGLMISVLPPYPSGSLHGSLPSSIVSVSLRWR